MYDSAKNLSREKTMEKNFSEISTWESSLIFLEEEIQFLLKLLITDIYESNIPNLYERLQEYSNKLQDFKKEETELKKELEKHKADLSGQLEEYEEQQDFLNKQSHVLLRKKLKAFSKRFSNLKLEIFNYAGNILKKRS